MLLDIRKIERETQGSCGSGSRKGQTENQSDGKDMLSGKVVWLLGRDQICFQVLVFCDKVYVTHNDLFFIPKC